MPKDVNVVKTDSGDFDDVPGGQQTSSLQFRTEFRAFIAQMRLLPKVAKMIEQQNEEGAYNIGICMI